MTKIRSGQAPGKLSRDEFRRRFRVAFYDPVFEAADESISRLEAIAWNAYGDNRKAPVTQKAGSEFADPDYKLSVEWRATRDKLRKLEGLQRNPSTRSRVLLIVGSARNDGSCPGEMSKTFRLATLARKAIEEAGLETDLLDLSLINLRLRPTHLPMQRLCLDRDALVSLAVQLLSKSCA